MSRFYKNIIWAIVLLLALSIVFSSVLENQAAPEKLSLNRLAEKVSAGEVSSIKVSGDDLEIALKNNTKAVSKKEAESGIVETLTRFGVDPKALLAVQIAREDQSGWQFWASILIPTVLPLLLIGGIFWFMLRQARTGVNQAFSFGRSTIRLSAQGKEKVLFKDVAGLKEAKEELVEVVDFLKNPKKFLDLGARIPRGVLLMGQPGTGKTLLARAVAGESNVPFFHVSASEFVEMFVGVGASVSGDTPVLIRKQGAVRLLPISEFADQYYNDNEEGLRQIPGIETLGYKPLETNFGHGGLQEKTFFGGSAWSNASGVYRHRVNKILKISYLGGEISTTGDHSVFIRKRNMVLSVKASDLKPGDVLVNLPFKVRSSFVPGYGTTHTIRSHAFGHVGEPYLDLYGEEYERQIEKYEFALSHRGAISQAKIGMSIGMSQSGVKDWQIGNRAPRILSSNLVRSGTAPRIKITPELMRLLGYYTAEGNVTRHATTFTFGLKEKELHGDCMRLVRELFGLEPAFLARPETNSARISVSSPYVVMFFEKQCGTGSRNKHVPELLWSLPKEYFLAYLEGYALGDGYTTRDGKLNATSVSRQLIRELTWLCAMHGIQAGVRKTVNKEGRIIINKPLPETVSWNLIIGKTSHPFSRLAQSGNQHKKPRVTKVEEVDYNGYVYDLCGCDGEAFFGGEKPILLHNSRIRDAFMTAKKASPSILFIDEIDAVGRQRGAGLGGGNDEREQTLNQILVELDGFERDTRVIVLAATNRPDVLDPALLRPGRFDRRVVLDLPDLNDREAILKIHSEGKALDKNCDLRKVAIRTAGFSGADLANLMNESAIAAARQNKKTIVQDDLYESVEKVLLGPERRSRVISDREKEITAYHEGGHALVAASLKGSEPVHKISIISRGFAGGYTMKLPNEDTRLRTKTEFLNDIAMMMGGYASEKLTFKDVTTGASNDIREASELARRLVTKYGMSETLGPMTFGKTEELIFLGREIATEKNYSEQVASKIDEEVHGFIERAYHIAEKILKDNKAALQKIASTLVEKETLEQEEFYELLKPFKIKALAV